MCVKAPVLVGGLLIFYRRQFSGGLIKPMNGSKAHQGGRCFQWRHRIVHSSIDRVGHIIPGFQTTGQCFFNLKADTADNIDNTGQCFFFLFER